VKVGVVKYLFTLPFIPSRRRRASPSREGQFDIGYPAACCREVHVTLKNGNRSEIQGLVLMKINEKK